MEAAIAATNPDMASLYGKAFQENGALMVRWSFETRFRLVMDFITQQQLYPKLNDFLRKKIR